MNFKDKLYEYVVHKNGRVAYEYERYVREHIEEHKGLKLKHYWILLKLNWFYRVKKKTIPYMYDDTPINPQEQHTQTKTINTKRLSDTKSNNVVKRNDIDSMIEILSQYDTISFDMYDTLIFRYVESPKDVFMILENWSKIPSFSNIRIEAEVEAREASISGEVELKDIYEVISKKIFIEVDKFIKKEIDIEKIIVNRNEYFYEIYKKLIELGKKIIVVTNMYLPLEVLREILDNAGYTNVQYIYESSDVGKSKLNGEIFEFINTDIGRELGKIIHIGDNYRMDIEGARSAGWKALYYQNINTIAKRDFLSKTIANSIYRALVNAKSFSGMQCDKYYIYGYVNAGYLVYGYCKWLYQISKALDIDKLLFASRDMFIVEKVYREILGLPNSNYVKVSRTATIHLVLATFVQHYLDWHVKRRFNLNNTIGCVLEELGLDFLKDSLKNYHLDEEEIFNINNYPQLKKMVEDSKELIENHYFEEKEAARYYYSKMVAPGMAVLFVDMGWKSSSASCLRYFLNEKCGYDLKFYSAMLGSEGHDFVERGGEFGDIFTYVFSSRVNKILQDNHNKNGKVWRRLYEIIFTSNEQSLLSYKLDEDKKIKFNYLRKEIRDDTIVERIHNGILDFCKDFREVENMLGINLEINGADAYAPLANAFSDLEYNIELFENFEVCFMAGNVKIENAELFKDVAANGGV